MAAETPDPGWADREILSEPFTWDAHGYPVIASTSPVYEPDAVQMFGTSVPT